MGLDSFKSDDTSASEIDGDKLEPSGDGPAWLDDFSSSEWNRKTAEEKVRYVRKNYIDDYMPSLTPGDWEYDEAYVVNCECGNKFLMYDEHQCDSCGLEFESSSRAVVKKRGE